jgi:membrane fusion protein, copper/silver efflux system
MKKATYSILLLLLLAGAFLAGSWYEQPAVSRKSGIVGRKGLYYVDPMHPAYKSPKPGIAPDCKMKLEPVFADS